MVHNRANHREAAGNQENSGQGKTIAAAVRQTTSPSKLTAAGSKIWRDEHK